MDPLEQATDDELVDELKNRYQGLLVLGCRDAPGDESFEQFCVWTKGGPTMLRGIVERGRDDIRKSLHSDDTLED